MLIVGIVGPVRPLLARNSDRGKIWTGGAQTNYFSRFLTRGGLRACFSGEPRAWQHAAEWLRSACILGYWLQNPPERTVGTNRKTKKMLRMRRKVGQRAARMPKAQAELAAINLQKVEERKTTSIASGPTALVLKKVRHVGQSKVR